jgi:hypothetical protein
MIYYGGYIKETEVSLFKKVLFRSSRGQVHTHFFPLSVSKHETFSEAERTANDKVEQPFFDQNVGYIIMFHATP